MARQSCNVDKRVAILRLVDHRVGKVIHTPLGVHYMHRCKMAVVRTYANHVAGNRRHLRVVGICSRHKGIGIACLNHHHTEIIAVKHLLQSLAARIAVASALLSEHRRIARTAFRLAVMADIYNLDAVKAHAESAGTLFYHLLVAEQHRDAHTLPACLDSGKKHIVGVAFAKHHAAWICLRQAPRNGA